MGTTFKARNGFYNPNLQNVAGDTIPLFDTPSHLAKEKWKLADAYPPRQLHKIHYTPKPY